MKIRSMPAAEPAEAEDPMRDIAERVRGITRENERLFQQLVSDERRFRGLAKAVWKVQEEERRRLARELHDGLGQTLTALTHQLERIQRESAGPEGQAGDPKARLADAVELARSALRETRELSRLLRPPVLDDLGLLPALSWLARTLGERTGLTVELLASGLEERLETEMETLVFRTVQEGLTNVLKHAGTRRAEVRLARRGRSLEISVTDTGQGFDAAVLESSDGAAGSGLRGMRDRLELFGGRLTLRSAPGAGTVLTAVVPLPNPEVP